jgi:hypothetical protein
LYKTANQLGICLNFHPICSLVEDLNKSVWRELHQLYPSPIINASFALHHIGNLGGVDVRNQILKRLRAMNPIGLVLSEPNIDHMEQDFEKRFYNCWNHFNITFDVIDELDLAPQEKDALKVSFFGREIADILGNPEDQRVERHETAKSWLRRLKECGYKPYQAVVLPDTSSSVVKAVKHEGHIGLDYGTETIVSVICAVPDTTP